MKGDAKNFKSTHFKQLYFFNHENTTFRMNTLIFTLLFTLIFAFTLKLNF